MKVYYKILKDNKLQGVAFCNKIIFESKKNTFESQGFKIIEISKLEFDEICSSGI